MHVRKIQSTRFIYQTILKMTSFPNGASFIAIVFLGVLENIFEICPFKRTNLNSVGLGGLMHLGLGNFPITRSGVSQSCPCWSTQQKGIPTDI